MEVFFKNLSSENTPTEELVEDVMHLVAETEDLVEKTGAHLPEHARAELKTTLDRIKMRCQQVKSHALAGVQQTDRFIRKYPYPSVGIAFSLGLLIGFLINRQTREEE